MGSRDRKVFKENKREWETDWLCGARARPRFWSRVWTGQSWASDPEGGTLVLSLWNLSYQGTIPGGLEGRSGSLESLKCR